MAGLSLEHTLTRCVKCNAPIADPDAVLDALRVGQEALDKASTLQFRGTAFGFPLSYSRLTENDSRSDTLTTLTL